ncbi:cobalamin biosynthesis protein [Methylobrevis pamukkalensis]|uniref:Cobalamin biosynthesis protein CbiG n=1 Tax=Methylobrevis pamukkalensis TaxID=1439726 RepID=A0A1E3H2R9_9HYPH|nr:cobalamin biosynthesis protein [Methylobrevis pamukkalensis]ODN69841.1 cobalamin biosynthesis protein CbiG [Methylobrevis pamukkalensis]
MTDSSGTDQRLAIGIGCRSGIAPEAVVALVETAIARLAPEHAATPAALFTTRAKLAEIALAQAAAVLGLALVHLPEADLQAVSERAVTSSERVIALFGVPSVAECAALAGAGPGARLVLPRLSENGVTCAIAIGGPS